MLPIRFFLHTFPFSPGLSWPLIGLGWLKELTKLPELDIHAVGLYGAPGPMFNSGPLEPYTKYFMPRAMPDKFINIVCAHGMDLLIPKHVEVNVTDTSKADIPQELIDQAKLKWTKGAINVAITTVFPRVFEPREREALKSWDSVWVSHPQAFLNLSDASPNVVNLNPTDKDEILLTLNNLWKVIYNS